MTSIRLPSDTETRVAEIAKQENTTKSEIIKKALLAYLQTYTESANPFALGKDLFGKYGSKQKNLSKDYKRILREKAYAKHAH